MFGTDLSSIRAKRLFEDADIELIHEFLMNKQLIKFYIQTLLIGILNNF